MWGAPWYKKEGFNAFAYFVLNVCEHVNKLLLSAFMAPISIVPEHPVISNVFIRTTDTKGRAWQLSLLYRQESEEERPSNKPKSPQSL